jgi:hypothetical protein
LRLLGLRDPALERTYRARRWLDPLEDDPAIAVASHQQSITVLQASLDTGPLGQCDATLLVDETLPGPTA